MSNPFYEPRVRETSSTTGTGATITLTGPVAGRQVFPAGLDTKTVDYAIEDGNAWEEGRATYNDGASTLTSRTVYRSSNANSAISLTGNQEVFLTVGSETMDSILSLFDNADADNDLATVSLANNKFLQGKDVGGTARDLLGKNGSDVDILGSSGDALTVAASATTFTNAVTVSGAFTSIGIDDNATGERLQLSDTITTVGGGVDVTHALTVQTGANAESRLELIENAGYGLFLSYIGDTNAIEIGGIWNASDVVAMTITRNTGEVNFPLQPCFSCHNSTQDDNVTGNGTIATVDFNSEYVDQNNDFASDTLTCPVGGNYPLEGTVVISGITSAADTVQLRIVTSNRTYMMRWDNSAGDLGDRLALQIGHLCEMDAADTATITIEITGEASDVCDVNGTSNQTIFSGYLAC